MSNFGDNPMGELFINNKFRKTSPQFSKEFIARAEKRRQRINQRIEEQEIYEMTKEVWEK